MTTNAGAQLLSKSPLGFDNECTHLIDNKVEIEKIFSPEFRNRLDAIVNFKPLSKEVVEKIASKFIKEFKTQLQSKHISLSITNKAYSYLCIQGYDPINGARIMEKMINEKIKQPIADEILFGKLHKGGKISINFSKDMLIFKIEGTKASSERRVLKRKSITSRNRATETAQN